MPKGYVIVTETIHDPVGMQNYARAASSSMSQGKVLVVDSAVEVLEGEWPVSQTVVMEFESVEAARAWYFSESYQAAAPLRHAAATANMVVVAGFDPASYSTSS